MRVYTAMARKKPFRFMCLSFQKLHPLFNYTYSYAENQMSFPFSTISVNKYVEKPQSLFVKS